MIALPTKNLCRFATLRERKNRVASSVQNARRVTFLRQLKRDFIEYQRNIAQRT